MQPEDRIGFVLYTLHERTLKMTVQFYPLAKSESRTTVLEKMEKGKWVKVAKSTISEEPYKTTKSDAQSWTALFRVENWDDTVATQYRVVAIDGKATYEGIIRKNPIDKEEIVVAAFTGNTWRDARMKPDIITNINAQDPDLLFFSGDQLYGHGVHLAHWLHFGRQFGDITRNRPTICIPDDHDVGNGNLWGEGGRDWSGKKVGVPNQGYGDPQYVKMVERAQTSNLPDPYDPTPIERGIGAYYTSLKIGPIDFAIVEDRKFKSSPASLEEYLTGQGIENTFSGACPSVPGQPVSILDYPGAKLMGDRQLAFLDEWATHWKGVQMKTVLSQTLFAKAHTAGKLDLDTNGWPQTPRNRAVETIRKAYALHINGDQHLATVVQYGVDDWRDSSYSFCVPAIYNHYTRYWKPNRKPDGQPVAGSDIEFAGDYFDTFENRLTVYAYANPKEEWLNKWANEFGRYAPGYGLIRFNVKTRKITMECWPRGVDVTDPAIPQYPGWPITIDQQDNYGRKAVAWLPTLKVSGMEDPVVQVIDEATKEILYTLRINGTSFTPKVFSKGTFTVRVGELDTAREQQFKKLPALEQSGAETLRVKF